MGTLLAALAVAAAASALPALGHAPKPDCVYIEGAGGTLYLNVETGAWRLFPAGGGEFSSDAADQLRIRGRRGTVSDASGIQPSTAADARLEGAFEVGGPGEVTFRDPTDGVDVRISDPEVLRAPCN
jgi:hypothetical protein